MESALYIVSTPIGNLQDITLRAVDVLKGVDCIAAEDTRHTKRLLEALGISKKMVSLHEHNEYEKAQQLIDWVKSGQSVALVSDAGTPLISDPGSILVRSARDQSVKVVPVPGACAVIAALSVSGSDSRRFVFEGFLPPKAAAKKTYLEQFSREERTVIFYESPHRIIETLELLAALFPERVVVLARELTKTFETVYRGEAGQVLNFVCEDSNQKKGEFVLILEGAEATQNASDDWLLAEKMMPALLADLPAKKASAIIAKVSGLKKNELYEYALSLKKER